MYNKYDEVDLSYLKNGDELIVFLAMPRYGQISFKYLALLLIMSFNKTIIARKIFKKIRIIPLYLDHTVLYSLYYLTKYTYC